MITAWKKNYPLVVRNIYFYISLLMMQVTVQLITNFTEKEKYGFWYLVSSPIFLLSFVFYVYGFYLVRKGLNYPEKPFQDLLWSMIKHWLKFLAIGTAALTLLLFAGAFVYILISKTIDSSYLKATSIIAGILLLLPLIMLWILCGHAGNAYVILSGDSKNSLQLSYKYFRKYFVAVIFTFGIGFLFSIPNAIVGGLIKALAHSDSIKIAFIPFSTALAIVPGIVAFISTVFLMEEFKPSLTVQAADSEITQVMDLNSK